METRRYLAAKDYPVLVDWYKAHKLPVAPPSYLQDGLVIWDGSEPVCAGFIYRLGWTPMFWIEGIISNPNYPAHARRRALHHLINGLTNIAVERGCELLMGSTPRETLEGVFRECGFGSAPEKYSHVAKRLG